MSLRVLLPAFVVSVTWCGPVSYAAPESLSPERFERVHQLIQPQRGESRWLDVPWLTSIWEARQRAAAEGKPILIWSAGGAPPIGGC